MIQRLFLQATVAVAFTALSVSCGKQKTESPVNLRIAGNDTVFYLSASYGSFDVAIECGSKWEVLAAGNPEWLSVSPSSGSGNERISIVAAPNAGAERRAVVSISASRARASVHVIQQGATQTQGTLLYREEMGAPEVTGSIPADEFAARGYAWTRLGEGASQVTYSGAGASVTNAMNSRYRYRGASGGNCCLLGTSGRLSIQDIQLLGVRSGTLSFGCSRIVGEAVGVFNSSELSVWTSVDGGISWSPVSYYRANISGWDLASASLVFPAGTTALSVRFEASGSGAIRIDDVALHTAEPVTHPSPAPQVTTHAVAGVTASSAVLSGTYAYAAASPAVTQAGIMWRTAASAEYPAANRAVCTASPGQPFFATVPALAAGTEYRFRAYVSTADGQSHYGQEQSFTTATMTAPQVTTSPVTGITATSATLGVSYTYTLSSPAVVEMGVMWRTAAAPGYPEGNVVRSPVPNVPVFATTISSLTAGTPYMCRGYVKMSDGKTHYGEELAFATQNAGSLTPQVTTAAATSLTPATALVGGSYTYAAASPAVTEFGVMWRPFASADYPANYRLISPTPLVTLFSATLSGLTGGVRYAFRAYAVTSDGKTHYGAEQFFTTPTVPYAPPQVTTLTASAITASSALLGAAYTYPQPAPGVTVTSLGVMWKPSSQPDYPVASRILRTPAEASFTTTVSGLEAGTSYDYRAFALTSDGQVHYGTAFSFSTAARSIVWGTVSITVISGFTVGAPSSALIRIPYSGNDTGQVVQGVSVTAAGVAAAGFANLSGLSPSLGVPAGEVVLTVTGTPTTAGEVRFTVGGLPGLNAPYNGVAANVTQPSTGSRFGATWDMSAITAENYANHVPVCKIIPNLVGSILLEENLTQNGTAWTEGVVPQAGVWGGSGFYNNKEGNTSVTHKYVSVRIKSPSKTISLHHLSASVRWSGAGPAETAVYVQAGSGGFKLVGNVSNGTNGPTPNGWSISCEEIGEVQNVAAGTVITIKLVPYAAPADNGTWFLCGLSLEGTE